MNSKTRSPLWLKETLSAMLVIIIAAGVMVLNPMAFWLSHLAIPLFLLFVLGAQGRQGFLLTALAGLGAILILGQGPELLVMVVPAILGTAALYLVVKKKMSFPISLALISLALFMGLALTIFLSVYLISGSDIALFSTQVADTMRSSLLTTFSSLGGDLPPSQLQLLQDTAQSITATYIQDLVPGIALTWSLLAGYSVLRLGQRVLRFESLSITQVPLFASLRVSPFLLLFFMLLYGIGMLAANDGRRVGSLLWNTGYGMTMFLGIVGGLSLLWNFFEVRLKFRHPFNKVLISVVVLYYLGSSWLTVLTIADSILDLRNLSGRSLYRWLRYKISRNDEEGK